jgi:hypothetical protein
MAMHTRRRGCRLRCLGVVHSPDEDTTVAISLDVRGNSNINIESYNERCARNERKRAAKCKQFSKVTNRHTFPYSCIRLFPRLEPNREFVLRDIPG